MRALLLAGLMVPGLAWSGGLGSRVLVIERATESVAVYDYLDQVEDEHYLTGTLVVRAVGPDGVTPAVGFEARIGHGQDPECGPG